MDIDISFDNNKVPFDKSIDGKYKKFKKIFIICFCIVFSFFLIVIYSRYKATSGLKINEFKVSDSALPDSFHGFKIVHFSDIYFGNTVDIKYLKEIADSINDLNPDIVVFTGDFSNNEIDDETKKNIIEIFSSINPTVGKYAISGDIDNIDFFNEIFNSSGFKNLNGVSANIFYKGNIPITIGNEDTSSDLFNILLVHKPDSISEYNSKFNLILAGHSLNGQINLPLIKKLFLREGSKKYYNSYYDFDGTPFYISSGIGTTNFKFRFNNRPSINLYRLSK